MPPVVAATTTVSVSGPSVVSSAIGVDWQPRSFLFAAFVLQPERQLLMDAGRPVRIGGRALDLLTALVERPGEVVSKETLMAHVWPRTFVDQANLKVTMAALRRALGEDVATPRFIATVVGRGYRFVALVRCFDPAGAGLPDPRVRESRAASPR